MMSPQAGRGYLQFKPLSPVEKELRIHQWASNLDLAERPSGSSGYVSDGNQDLPTRFREMENKFWVRDRLKEWNEFEDWPGKP